MIQENIEVPVTATFASRLASATPFRHFDARLEVSFDKHATELLGKDYWRVLTPFKFYVGKEANNIWVLVPAGFVTDGATVPRPFWWLIPPWGNYGQAAVVHDYLCDNLSLYFQDKEIPITRKRADQIFRSAMEVAGVSWWKRNLMYYAVRLWDKFGTKQTAERLALKRQLQEEWKG